MKDDKVVQSVELYGDETVPNTVSTGRCGWTSQLKS